LADIKKDLAKALAEQKTKELEIRKKLELNAKAAAEAKSARIIA
jgi:hypothetical protein